MLRRPVGVNEAAERVLWYQDSSSHAHVPDFPAVDELVNGCTGESQLLGRLLDGVQHRTLRCRHIKASNAELDSQYLGLDIPGGPGPVDRTLVELRDNLLDRRPLVPSANRPFSDLNPSKADPIPHRHLPFVRWRDVVMLEIDGQPNVIVLFRWAVDAYVNLLIHAHKVERGDLRNLGGRLRFGLLPTHI